MSGVTNVPPPVNEPILSYAPGTPARATLKAELARLSGEVADIPAIVNGKEIRGGDVIEVRSPHNRHQVIAKAHLASADVVREAARGAVAAQREWAALRYEDRAAVFLRAAEMLATTHRALLNAATMLGQSKTAFQAEIDSACELIDFWRFNVAFGERLMTEQPASGGGAWNRMDHRPLEGFVYAVTPFNFTAIGGNLPTAPALMGNTAVWKPSHTALLSNYYIYKLLEAAGLPPGVVNFVPSEPVMCTGVLVEDPHFAGGALHRLHRGLPPDLAPGGEPARQVRLLPADRGRDRWQGFRDRPPERRSPGNRGRPRAGRVRVPGPEVQRRLPGLYPRHALARGARPHGRHDGGDPHGRRGRLPQLHGRGHRPAGLPADHGLPRRRALGAGGEDRRGRWRGRQAGGGSSSRPWCRPTTRAIA